MVNKDYKRELMDLKFKLYYHSKDKKLKEELINQNINLIGYVSRKTNFKKLVSFDEIESYGKEGLIFAVEHYNPYMNVKFSSYAYKCIIGYININFFDQYGISNVNIFRAYFESKVELEDETGLSIYDNEFLNPQLLDKMICHYIKNNPKKSIKIGGGYSDKDIEKYKINFATAINMFNSVSYDDSLYEEELNYLGVDDTLEDITDSKILRETIDEIFNECLTKYEIEILKYTYSLDGEYKSLRELSGIYGKSGEAIRQNKERALRKIRENPKCVAKLKDFW